MRGVIERPSYTYRERRGESGTVQRGRKGWAKEGKSEGTKGATDQDPFLLGGKKKCLGNEEVAIVRGVKGEDG